MVERKERVKEMGGERGRWEADSDGDLGRYEGKRAVWVFFFKYEGQGGRTGWIWQQRRDKMKEIWSDMKAQGNMNIMLGSSVMCEGEKERK